MTLQEIIAHAIDPALELLPEKMRGANVRMMLLAIGLQESRFEHRKQIKGPARGFWQFELGSEASRGGVWGVYMHALTRECLRDLCWSRGVQFGPAAIYRALETDDVLAAGLARLLLWTDPEPLPGPRESQEAWSLYLRTWRPGRPHPETWQRLFAQALQAAQLAEAQ